MKTSITGSTCFGSICRHSAIGEKTFYRSRNISPPNTVKGATGKSKAIAPKAQACLLSYHRPGNVREFENAIERAVVLGTTETIMDEDLPESVIMTGPPRGSADDDATQDFYDSVKEAKKRLIANAVEQAQGSYTEAARFLGIHPNHLHRLIRNLGMKAELKK